MIQTQTAHIWIVFVAVLAQAAILARIVVLNALLDLACGSLEAGLAQTPASRILARATLADAIVLALVRFTHFDLAKFARIEHGTLA